jgi:hypothetical protein
MGGYALYQSGDITIVEVKMQKNVAGRKTGALCRSIRVALRRGKNLSLGYVRETRIPMNNEHVNEYTAIAQRRIIIR